MNTLLRAVLLVAPVIDSLQAQLAAEFPLLRLYEQDDPIAFLREQGENIAAVVTRGDVGCAKQRSGAAAARGAGGYLWRGDRCGGSGTMCAPARLPSR